MNKGELVEEVENQTGLTKKEPREEQQADFLQITHTETDNRD